VNSSLGFANVLSHIDVGGVHTVVNGDTLYDIARVNGICWGMLASHNHIPNPRLIFPGQQIWIPDVHSLSVTNQFAPEQSIEELGAIIVSSGIFWGEWWQLNGRFDFEHIKFDPSWWEANHPTREHVGHARVLPTSGFESLNDIRKYLLQYYTESRVKEILIRDLFIEHNNMIYTDVDRAGFSQPNWETAIHTLIEQEGSRVVVRTTVLSLIPYDAIIFSGFENNQFRYYYTFIDGRIDNVVLYINNRRQ